MAPTVTDQIIEVFISYSHKDETLCNELDAQEFGRGNEEWRM